MSWHGSFAQTISLPASVSERGFTFRETPSGSRLNEQELFIRRDAHIIEIGVGHPLALDVPGQVAVEGRAALAVRRRIDDLNAPLLGLGLAARPHLAARHGLVLL